MLVNAQVFCKTSVLAATNWNSKQVKMRGREFSVSKLMDVEECWFFQP